MWLSVCVKIWKFNIYPLFLSMKVQFKPLPSHFDNSPSNIGSVTLTKGVCLLVCFVELIRFHLWDCAGLYFLVDFYFMNHFFAMVPQQKVVLLMLINFR